MRDFEKGFSPVYILIVLAVGLVILGGVLIFSGSEKKLPVAGDVKVTSQKAEEGSKSAEVAVEDKVDEKSSNKVPASMAPVSTPKAATDALPDYDQLEGGSLSRVIPDGWTYAVSSDGVFEIAYNPNVYSHESSTSKVLLKKNLGGAPFSVSVLPYDGGSRHAFIASSYGVSSTKQISTDSTYEKNYTYNGKSGLGIYNVDLSAITTVGMLNIDNKRAYLFGSDTNPEETEQIISTLKVLK